MSRILRITLALFTCCSLTASTLSAQRGGGGGGIGGGGRGGGRTTASAPQPAARGGDATVEALAVDPASHLAGIAKVISAIDTALAQKAPDGLAKADQADWDGESKWLTASRTQLSQLSKKLGVFAKDAAKATAAAKAAADTAIIESKPDAQKIADANVQFLALRKQLTTAGDRHSQTISVADKARHDMVMNAIRNMK